MIREILSPIWAIALNSFRETVRNKMLASLLGFAVVVSLVALVLGEMSMHNEARVAKDVTLAVSAAFGLLIAIYASVTLLTTEFERRTIYTILSKPIHRWQFILGKFLGVEMLLGCVVLILGLVSYGVIWGVDGEAPSLAAAYYTLFLQLSVVAAFAIMFAAVTSPLLSGLYTAGLFIAGNLTSQVEAIAELLEKQASFLSAIVTPLPWLLPNFEALNLSYELTYDIHIPAQYLLSATWYTFTYTLIVLLLAFVLFGRKDFV